MNDYFATTDKLNNKHFLYSSGIVTYVKKTHKKNVYFDVVLFLVKFSSIGFTTTRGWGFRPLGPRDKILIWILINEHLS